MLTAIRPLMLVMAFCGAMSLASCSDSSINKDNPTPEPTPGLKELEEWQAGAIVSQEAVDAFGYGGTRSEGYAHRGPPLGSDRLGAVEQHFAGLGEFLHQVEVLAALQGGVSAHPPVSP